MSSKKIKLVRIIGYIVTTIIVIALIVYLFPVIKNLSTQEGQVAFKEKVDESGLYGFLTLLGLQFAQIFLVILPGEPLEVLAGMCYGAVGGTLFILFSVALSTTILFWFVRIFGREFVYQTFGQKRIEKIENSKIFQNPKKIEYIFAICFAIIGPPKDLLVYIGALLPIKPTRFILIATFCRFPSIISSTIVGEHFSQGNWKMSIIIYGVTFIFTAIVLLIIKMFDKEKVTEKALNELK